MENDDEHIGYFDLGLRWISYFLPLMEEVLELV